MAERDIFNEDTGSDFTYNVVTPLRRSQWGGGGRHIAYFLPRIKLDADF